MIKVKALFRDKSYHLINACELLADINDTEMFRVLQSINWKGEGKFNFLIGEAEIMMAKIKPLSRAEARKAIKEYEELGYK